MSIKFRSKILVQLTLDELRQVVGALRPSYDEVKSLEHYGALWGGMGGETWRWNDNFSKANRDELMDINNKINDFYR